MNFLSAGYDYDLAYCLAQELSLFNQNKSITARQPFMSANFGERLQVQDFPDNGLVPAHSIWFGSGGTIITILGARTTFQANTLAANYLRAPVPGRDLSLNAAAAGPSLQILTDALASGASLSGPVLVGGHSFGGLVGEAIMQRLIQNAAPGPLSLTTFGTPRPGFPGFWNLAAGCSRGRFNGRGDPVVRLPFHSDEAPIPNALLTAAQQAIVQEYTAVNGGITIDDTTNVVTEPYPPLPSFPVSLSFAAFLISWESDAAGEHYITRYASRLLTIATHYGTLGFTPPVTPPTPPAPQGAPENPPATPKQIKAALLTAQQTTAIANAGDPTELPYKAIRNPQGWCVQGEDIIFAVCDGKRSAKRMARALNSAWRAWHHNRLSDHTGLEQTIEDIWLDPNTLT